MGPELADGVTGAPAGKRVTTADPAGVIGCRWRRACQEGLRPISRGLFLELPERRRRCPLSPA
jgi:hypothetical protein